jgi:hypothetical protein
MYKNLYLKILKDIQIGLDYYSKNNHLNLPANYRLAFRELGLAIGLKAVKRMTDHVKKNLKLFPLTEGEELILDSLTRYLYLAGRIEEFWSKQNNQKASSWIEHRNINRVMQGTCLAPDGFLKIY